MSLISDKIASAIATGKITMRPRWYFILRAALMLIGGLLLVLLLLYVISFVIFTLRQTGIGFVPVFGLRGWIAFLRHAPWFLMLLSLAFVLILELLVRRYAFAYRRPLLYSVGAIFIISLSGGFMLAASPLHPRLLQYAYQHHLPFGERIYRDIDEQRFPDVYRGMIVATTSSGFILQQQFGTSSVVVTGATMMRGAMSILPGDTVIILGDSASDTIRAFGLRPGRAMMK